MLVCQILGKFANVNLFNGHCFCLMVFIIIYVCMPDNLFLFFFTMVMNGQQHSLLNNNFLRAAIILPYIY